MINPMATRRHSAVSIALLVLFLSGCGSQEPAPEPEVVRPVKTVTVGGSFAAGMTFPAVVEAGEKAVLSFRVSGRLVELPIEEGQSVTQGQLIGRLDDRDFRIAVDQARAQFQKAESDLKRYQTLYEREAVPLADLELRRSERDVARAKLDEAESNLSYTRLTAPFSGQIGRRYVENHMDVNAQREIVDLNDIGNMEIHIDVAESVVRSLQEGVKPELVALFDNAPSKEYALRVKELANRADPATQTFRIRLSMPQPAEFNLLPGMTATVKARLPEEERTRLAQAAPLVVPTVAVSQSPDGQSYVWVVDTTAWTVHRRAVKLGAMTGTEDVRVEEGLRAGERVVTAGLPGLEDGMKVRDWQP